MHPPAEVSTVASSMAGRAVVHKSDPRASPRASPKASDVLRDVLRDANASPHNGNNTNHINNNNSQLTVTIPSSDAIKPIQIEASTSSRESFTDDDGGDGGGSGSGSSGAKRLERHRSDPTPLPGTPKARLTRKLSYDIDLSGTGFSYSPLKKKGYTTPDSHQKKLAEYKKRRAGRSNPRSLSGSFNLCGSISGSSNFGLSTPKTPTTPSKHVSFKDKGSSSSNSNHTPKLKSGTCDRFIPSRKLVGQSREVHNMPDAERNTDSSHPCMSPQGGCTMTGCATHELLTSPIDRTKRDFNTKLSEALLGVDDTPKKLLQFASPQMEKAPVDHQRTLRELYAANLREQEVVKPTRHISNAPERILDAPALLDDYYLNLLHWSPRNILAVGLGSSLYLWNASTGEIDQLVENSDPDNFITSVRWNDDGSTLAVGSTDTTIQIWDVGARKKFNTLNGHVLRVSALAWNQQTLSSGSRDATIINHDPRVAAPVISTWRAHEEEICGLEWSRDGSQLAAGGNDNVCSVWDKGGTDPRHMFQHTAAVKALAWCPFQANLLATGGGTADRHIRFFNTSTGKLINAVDSKSQVCSLEWSKHGRELLSAHGFSQNQLTVWKYPQMTQVANLTGHTSRVLHTSISPDGTTVCSAAADETLRFWRVWEPPTTKKKTSVRFTSLLSRNIR